MGRIQNQHSKNSKGAYLEDRLSQLIKTLTKNQKADMRAELAIHGEKLGGIWTQINKDKKLCNMIHRLRRLGLPPPQYERKSPQMVNLARNYHNNLQHQGIMAQTEHERTRDIDHTLRAIPPTQLIDDPNRSPMSET